MCTRVSSRKALMGLAALLALGLGVAVPTSSSALLEAPPLPTVESPQLPDVQVPAIPNAEAPSPPPVEVPSTPIAAPEPPSVPALGSGSTTNAGGDAAGGTGAHAASAAGSTPTANSPRASTAGSPTVPAKGPNSRPRGARGIASPRTRTARTAHHVPAAARTTSPASLPIALARSSARQRSPRTAATSNPLDAIGRHIPFPVPVPDWSKPIILLLLVLAIWFAGRSRLVGVRARRLERQRTTLVEDLGVVQRTLAPVIPERLGGLGVSVAYRPADGPAAGGDFYDVFALGPGRVAIILGDVVGHGHDALTEAALARYTLRAYMQAGLEPRATLALAGSVLADPDQKHLATVVIGVHDAASGTLTYASAGHPPPIAIGFEAPEPLTICSSAPIGCHLPTGRRQTTISLPAGGGMCFFSDGLLEAPTADGLLGRERLVEIVDELGPGCTGAGLLERVRSEAGAIRDDMVACLVVSEAGQTAIAGPVEELEVDLETLARPQVRGFLEACDVQAAHIAPLLARARRTAGVEGTVLLRVERRPAGDASVAVLPGLSAPDWAAAGVAAASAGPAPAVSIG
jgi:Stage II sporulation protein E (SpoIIE)